MAGVHLREFTRNTSVNARNRNIVAIVGGAKTGTFEPTLVYGKTQLKKMFGESTATDYALIGAELILQKADRILFCRVANKGSKAKFKDDTKAIFEAKEGGTNLNTATVNVTVAEDNKTIEVSVTKDEVKLEVVKTSLDPANTEYIYKVFNKYSAYLNLKIAPEDSYTFKTGDLTVEVGSEGAKPSTGTGTNVKVATKYPDSYLAGAKLTIQSSIDNRLSAVLTKNGVLIDDVGLGTPGESAQDFVKRFNAQNSYFIMTLTGSKVTGETITIVGGNDGISGLKADDYIGNSEEGLKALNDVNGLEIQTLIVPGVSDSAVITYAQSLATSMRQDCVYIPDSPQGLKAYQMVNWVDGEGIYSRGSRLDSSYVFPASPWTYINYDGENILVPPSIIIARQLCASDIENPVWYAPAGIKRGVLDIVTGLEYKPNDDDIHIMYEGSFINPIVYMKDVGYVLWGNKTAVRSPYPNNPTPLASLNVRRLMNYIKKALGGIALGSVFDQNDDYTWQEFKDKAEPILRNIKSQRGLVDFQLVMDETTTTDADKDALAMKASLKVTPTRAGEDFFLNFEVNPSGVTFYDEGGVK